MFAKHQKFQRKQVRASQRRRKTHRVALIHPSDVHDLLRLRLSRLAECTATGSLLSVACPEDDVIRVRNLVHRGAPRPVSKYPSFKLGRTLECESLLEVDLATLLDASPAIKAFAEQSVVLNYRDGEPWRFHVPDFVVLCGDRLRFMEVKFLRDVDMAVLTRSELLKVRLAPLGVSYELVTEEQIRAEFQLDNARQLLRRGRHTLPDIELLGYLERLRRHGVQVLGDWGWNQSGSREAIGIARLVLQGKVWVDMCRPLGAASAVKVHETEVASWPLDRFA